jgi:hypothetical protein
MDITVRSDFEETSKLSFNQETLEEKQNENELYAKERMLGQGAFGKVKCQLNNRSTWSNTKSPKSFWS